MDDRYLRFQMRLWDGTRMHEPLDFYWYEEQGVLDCDDIRRAVESAGEGAALMQCTGLRDKRGRAIYEGDIVDAWSAGSHARGVVTWGQGASFFLAIPPPQAVWYLCSPRDLGEVIGNVYQHPHLVPERSSDNG